MRNPTLGSTPYVGRAFIDQMIPLSDTSARHDRDPLHLLRALPERRIEIRAGKLSTADVFDVNAAGSDSHLEFMNWAVDNSGSYDYAADTRGYTLGAIVGYIEPRWALRFGELAMPTVANGIDYDSDVAHARGENLELELHGRLAGRPGIVRLLGFLRGTPWHREGDELGLAAVSNGLASDHRRYLELGGKGFLLGDGRLGYGRETIVEAYYNARTYRGVFVAADLQLIVNPGYNRERGPVGVGSLRLHVEL